jgi:hypothetical protein
LVSLTDHGKALFVAASTQEAKLVSNLQSRVSKDDAAATIEFLRQLRGLLLEYAHGSQHHDNENQIHPAEVIDQTFGVNASLGARPRKPAPVRHLRPVANPTRIPVTRAPTEPESSDGELPYNLL